MSVSLRSCLAGVMACALSAAAAAQSISGKIIGLDDAATGATVTALTETGELIGEVVVAKDGTFSYEARGPIGKVVVRQEAVAVEHDIAGGSAENLAIDVQAAMQWSRRGRLIDPDGQAAFGLDVLVRDERKQTVACVTTDEKGDFVVRGNVPVTSLVVDPIGWHHEVPVKFARDSLPLDATPDVVVDLRPFAKRLLLLAGKLTDLDGNAVAGAKVMASKPGARAMTICGVTRTKSDGTFRLWTAKGVTKIVAKKGAASWERPGDWQKAATGLALDEKRDGIVMVTGKVVDREGRPAVNAIIYTSDAAKLKGGRRGIAGTNQFGQFRVFIRRATPFLVAHLRQKGGTANLAGPWPRDEVVLRAGK